MVLVVYILFLVSMISFICPFLVWFGTQIMQTRGTYTWKQGRIRKRAFYICLPFGTLTLILGVVIAFV